RCSRGRAASGTTRSYATILAMESVRRRWRRAGGPRSGCTGSWRPGGPKRCGGGGGARGGQGGVVPGDGGGGGRRDAGAGPARVPGAAPRSADGGGEQRGTPERGVCVRGNGTASIFPGGGGWPPGTQSPTPSRRLPAGRGVTGTRAGKLHCFRGLPLRSGRRPGGGNAGYWTAYHLRE